MTDEELVSDLERVLSAAIMRGASIEEVEAAIEEAKGRVDSVKEFQGGAG